MTPSVRTKSKDVYPRCRSIVSVETWDRLTEEFDSCKSSSFSQFLATKGRRFPAPPFLSDLARLEEAFERLKKFKGPLPDAKDRMTLNPSLQVVELSWMNLTSLWDSEAQNKPPQPAKDWALLWRDPKQGDLRVKSASNQDLLALKILTDDLSPKKLAQEEGIPIHSLEEIIDRAGRSGLLITPASRIRRSAGFPVGSLKEETYFTASVFTLQWHLTQACDLHCKHCYDRSDRYSLRLQEGLEILDDFSRFCQERHVRGQVSFTGGNPLLYARFPAL